ncbi:hypothetical protein J2Y48_003004 [Mycoplana sp. BE70]|uniref:hypothetical protein n=1 Tax=Mycoplana sp. BE70 TaxID=2817775 RepID=UPI0028672DCC|nr:hypothetical protein [Mycoplana sp. BE70]MDR6757707.1 hypothetical protein [Mycoplana sp. BE70]
MTNATAGVPSDAEPGQHSAEFLNRIAEKMRLESGSGLPRDYFLQLVRRQLADTGSANPSRDARYQSSACFDAWAKPDSKIG